MVHQLHFFVDDSGSWGKGGVFTAISKRSEVPEKQYELAGNLLGMYT